MRQVTVAEWSAEVGISRQAAYRVVDKCGIPIVGGKLDAEAATILYRSRTRARTNPRVPGGMVTNDAPLQVVQADGGEDYWVSRARREKAEADKAELELAERRKDLVRASDVRSAQAKRLAALRESLLQIPARLAPVLAAESDSMRCHDALQRELHAVLCQAAID